MAINAGDHPARHVAVRVHITDSDFYLLPEDDTADSGAELLRQLTQLREAGGTLRLRPRTAPPADEEPGLTGHEDPGTSWRDVLGEAIGDADVVEYDPTVAFWHWAVEPHGGDTFEVG